MASRGVLYNTERDQYLSPTQSLCFSSWIIVVIICSENFAKTARSTKLVRPAGVITNYALSRPIVNTSTCNDFLCAPGIVDSGMHDLIRI